MQNGTQGNGVMIGYSVVERAAGDGRTAVDIWLDANIKACNVAEYQRYRSYLTSGAYPAGELIGAAKK